jgi:16S rRNA (uracil1498-N3)-methyltransferase
MEIAPPHSIGEVLVDFHAASHRYIAHPGADNWQPGRGQGDTCVLIGPEGGFTDDELHAASSAGWQAASLAPAILRIETAAVAAAAILGPR